MATQQDFGDFTDLRTSPQTSRRQLNVIQTRNGSAVDAQKVRMTSSIFGSFLHGLKSPDVIAEFGPPKQP